jgi:hypothetical protein
MPYSSLSDAPASWKKLGDVTLTLSQVNWIAKIYDALVAKGLEKGVAAGTAINKFKKSHKMVDGKWVAVKKEEDEANEVIEITAEEIEGGLEEFRNRVRQALRAKHPTGYSYLRDITGGNSAIYEMSDPKTGETKTYKAQFAEVDGQFIFGDPQEVEIKEVVKPVQPAAEEKPKGAPNTLADFLIEETVTRTVESEAGLQFNLAGHILLEEKDPAQSDSIKARVPMIKFGALTDNKNRYLEECWDALSQEIALLNESKTKRRVLDMYPTHRPALDPKDPDYFMLRAAKITGASKQGDVGFIHFETLRTEAGRTMAVQVQEGMVDGVSLRAYPRPGYYLQNEQGGLDVRQLLFMGSDFTDIGAMPIDEGQKGFHLEEKHVMNLEELKKTDPEAYNRVMAEAAQAEAAKAKPLTEENERLKKQLAEEAAQRRKTSLIEHIRAAIAKVKDFGDTVKANVLEEVTAVMDRIMAEQANDDVAKLKLEEVVANAFNRRKAEIAEALKETMKGQQKIITDPSVISTLTTEARQAGLTKEITGGSTRIRDLLLAKVFNRPVYESGRFLLESWADKLEPLIRKQLYYMDFVGKMQNDIFAAGGMLHNMLLSEEMNKAVAPLLTEANEGTTTGVISTNLPHEVAAALIYAAWPETIAMQICQTGDMTSSTKDIFEVGYPTGDNVFKRGQHEFGWVDEANPTTLVLTTASPTTYGDFVDEGALAASSNQYADHLFARLVEAPVGIDMVITITGTDENGTAATWTVTFLTTDALGTIKRCAPTNVGQKCTDVTAVSVADSGTLTAGQVGFFVEKPVTGATAGSAEDKTYLGITKSTATADDYDLGARLDISLIEDMQMAMKDGGGGLDYLALIVSTLKKAIIDQIDRKVLYEVIDDATGGSQTFAQSTPESGYTQAEWNKRFLYYCDLLVDETSLAGNMEPNWMVWSRADRSRFMDWLAEGWTKYNVNRNELHLNSRTIGNVSGCEVFVSPNARRSRVATGTNQSGVHYYVYVPFVLLGPTWVPDTKVKAIMVHHRAAFKVTQPLTLGKLAIS